MTEVSASDLQTLISTLQNGNVALGNIAKALSGIATWIAPPPGQQLANISAAGTSTLKTSAGVVQAIKVNTKAIGTLSLYDGLSTSGKLLATIDTNVTDVYDFPLACSVGITVVQVGTANVTVAFY